MMWRLDRRCIRHFADDGGEDGAGGGGGGEAKTTWWEEGEFAGEQIAIASRYNDRKAFNAAFFEQRKAISAQIKPPDPGKLKPDEYASKLRDYRARAGGLTDPKAVKVTWPEDIAAVIEGRLPGKTEAIRHDAVKYGLTQAEVDERVEELSQEVRTFIQTEQQTNQENEQKRNRALADADKMLTELWGDEKETNIANAMLAVAQFDSTLLARDNETLSEEEIADRGGKLAQDLRNMDPDVRQRFIRLFNNLHRRLFAESRPPDQGGAGHSNLYNDRYAKAKLQWPNRPELWDQVARSNAQL